MELYLRTFEFEGHAVKLKVTEAKNAAVLSTGAVKGRAIIIKFWLVRPHNVFQKFHPVNGDRSKQVSRRGRAIGVDMGGDPNDVTLREYEPTHSTPRRVMICHRGVPNRNNSVSSLGLADYVSNLEL